MDVRTPHNWTKFSPKPFVTPLGKSLHTLDLLPIPCYSCSKILVDFLTQHHKGVKNRKWKMKMDDAEYKSKLSAVRSKYLNTIEKASDSLGAAMETLESIAENEGLKAGDRIKAANSIIEKVGKEISDSETRELKRSEIESNKGSSGNNIPVGAAIEMMKAMAGAFGIDTSHMDIKDVTPDNNDYARIPPTTPDNDNNFSHVSTPSDEQVKNEDQINEDKEYKDRQSKKRNDYLSTIGSNLSGK